MPKLKTHQATAKKFTITKRGKVMKRKAGQDHFNARESGKITRAKRRDVQLTSTHFKRIKQAMPGCRIYKICQESKDQSYT
jgi:large subunit ribosomal protein L35